MLYGFLGRESFRVGLQMYVRKYMFQNAEMSELWETFSEVWPVRVIKKGPGCFREELRVKCLYKQVKSPWRFRSTPNHLELKLDIFSISYYLEKKRKMFNVFYDCLETRIFDYYLCYLYICLMTLGLIVKKQHYINICSLL